MANVSIEQEDVKQFFDYIHSKSNSFFASNLQSNLELASKRDKHEFAKVLSKIISNQSKVLDIGCGNGRIAMHCKDTHIYYGLDFSLPSVKNARAGFANYPHMKFDECDVTKNLEEALKLKGETYNVIIVGGLLTYINDHSLSAFLQSVKKFSTPNAILYFREPVSLLDQSLTLKDHFSDELQHNYNSIYRTMYRYQQIFDQNLFADEYTEVNKGYLLDKELQNRKETSQYYWVFKKYDK